MANFNIDNYIPVHERITKFYRDFPEGKINTEILEHDVEKGFVLIRASVYRTCISDRAASTGHAFEERSAGYGNKTSYIENAETSAVGRALALLGFEITKGVASREEMQKVQRMQSADLKVVRENGHYLVAGFKIAKDSGKVTCTCKQVGCAHIEAVRKFTTEEAA